MWQTVEIRLDTDDRGMIGRECPNSGCGRYFKLKPGTGLDTQESQCPYCGTQGTSIEFLTSDQQNYARVAGAKQILDPILQKFEKDLRKLNTRQRKSPLQISVSVKRSGIKLPAYQEKRLETDVFCDKCGLEFAVYGVFASCPDCGQLNALTVCLSSLETARKRISLSLDSDIDVNLRRALLQDALGSTVEAFDAYGKAVRSRSTIIAENAKSNLFQDIELLDKELRNAGIPSIENMIGIEPWGDLKWFFQARHVYTHNAGVVDRKFVAKLPAYTHMLGRVLPLDADRVSKNIESISLLAKNIDASVT